MPRDDYRGDFDPHFELSHLSRQGLAVLGREYMLSGQLQDRSAMPMVLGRLGVEARIGIAIDEWMSASPVYSARMQRALRFSGTDIGTLFKNLQLDIGFSHSYMHVGYRLENEGYGEFWLDCCGALMDVEPFGEDMVRGMCHDIEDPTFDATAAATNPLIKIRPIHRPPRSPADREPHCRWKVFIDDAPNAEPFEMHPNLAIVASSKLADVALVDPGDDAEPGGRADYTDDFDPDFTLEDLSHRALVLTVQEFAVQCHVLCRSFLLTMAQRLPEDELRTVASAQWTGIAGLTPNGSAPRCGSTATMPARSPSCSSSTRASIPAPTSTPTSRSSTTSASSCASVHLLHSRRAIPCPGSPTSTTTRIPRSMPSPASGTLGPEPIRCRETVRTGPGRS
ncbi:MAG TPA: hypothetical protein VIJ44_07495 [Acidimicrobiia bacterium]